MINNRIVFLPQELPKDDSNLVYYQAIDQMRINITDSAILLMINNNMTNESARDMMDKYKNAGLIIEWYKVDDNIRIDIYEPVTQNQLAGLSLPMTDLTNLSLDIDNLVSRLEQLITSELLPLNELQMNDPYDPVWDKIRSVLDDNSKEVN